MILNHINYSKKLNLKYVYLGYWVNGSNKMQYKSSFSGLEVFASQEWRPLTKHISKNLNKPSNKDTMKKPILEIKLSS
jgi:arginine-tRNA-protein transferase